MYRGKLSGVNNPKLSYKENNIGDYYIASHDGYINNIAVKSGDHIVFKENNWVIEQLYTNDFSSSTLLDDLTSEKKNKFSNYFNPIGIYFVLSIFCVIKVLAELIHFLIYKFL